MICSKDVYPVDLIRKSAIRIVKKTPGIYGLPLFEFQAAFNVKISSESNLFYETANEFVVYVEHEHQKGKACIHARFETNGHFDVSTILFEKEHLPFEMTGSAISFDFDVGDLTEATRTLSIHTLIQEPGLRIRLEHNHPGRKAGMYRTNCYPEKQIQAAHHYIMAMREIIRMLDIPAYLAKNDLGYMYVLGFETNNEIHTDYPPHWHLIYRWKNYVGSQAPHFYLDKNGATTYNKSYIDGIYNFSRTFDSDEWCKFVDCNGKDVCAVCVHSENGVLVTKPGGDIFHMSNYSDDGVAVSRNGVKIGRITVTDLVEKGIYEVQWLQEKGSDSPPNYVQRIIYDPLTGMLLDSTMSL